VPHRNLLAPLAVVLATVALPAITALPAVAAPAAATAALTEQVAGPGVYNVTVAVVTRGRSGRVALRIGAVSRNTVTARGSDRATVQQRVSVTSNRLVIRATATSVKPSLKARITRVSGLGASGGKTAGSSGVGGSASGSTGTTGTTGDTGAPSGAPASGSGSGSGSGGSGATSGPPGDPSSWNLTFQDDFSSLNTSVWSTSRFDNGQLAAGFNTQEQECFDPAQTSVGGGEADLNLVADQETCNGQSQPYAGSILTTSLDNNPFTFTYGYMEAKIWMPGSNGQIADWPAFWAVGYNDSWPAGGELDVVEGLGGQACYHFHDPSGGPGGCSTGDYTGGWHTFGADWEPGSVTWYYDGQDVGSVTSGITDSPMAIYLDMAVEPGDPVEAPATMRVQYVKLWQHPAS
jgi:beta-glucanase (GH16 family)